MDKFLAIDYGQKRIGVATGSIYPKAIGLVAHSEDEAKTIASIRGLIHDDLSGLVVGLPHLKSGDEGRLVPEIKNFALKLAQELKLSLYYEPEEYSSLEANEFMKKYAKESQNISIDEVAACLILDQFLGQVEKKGLVNMPAAWKPFDSVQDRPFDSALFEPERRPQSRWQGKPFDITQGKPFDSAQGKLGDK